MSWRINFINIVNSNTFRDENSPVRGFTVVRSPKGTKEGIYIPPNNPEIIGSMLGFPSEDYPDIQELMDFNTRYGCYVSAPSGYDDKYPSYYGGVYITKYGFVPFYKQANKKEFNFKGIINTLKNTEAYNNNIITPLLLGRPHSASGGNLYTPIVLPKIAPRVIDNASSFFIKDFSSIEHEVFIKDADNSGNGEYKKLVIKNDSNDDITVGYIYKISTLDLDNGSKGGFKSLHNPTSSEYVFVIGKYDTSKKTFVGMSVEGFNNNLKGFLTWDGSGNKFTLTIDGVATELSFTEGGDESSITKFLTDNFKKFEKEFTTVLDIQKYARAALYQKSPTEVETSVKFKKIGYDKYRYAARIKKCDDTINKLEDFSFEEKAVPSGSVSDGSLEQDIWFAKDRILIVESTESTITGQKKYYIFSADYSNDEETHFILQNITGNYEEKYILMDNAGTFKMLKCDNGVLLEAEPLIDLDFNTLNFSITEKDLAGSLITGGSFKLSLDEQGTDNFGVSIYAETILPEDALTFVEIKVFKTFDEDISEVNQGLFTGLRVPNNTIITLKGQRSIHKRMAENKKKIGLSMPNVNTDIFFEKLITEGWDEFKAAKYGDCRIAFDSTGLDKSHLIFKTLRENNKRMTTFISNRLLNDAEVKNPNKINVLGRVNQGSNVQIVGEALVSVGKLRKKYYRTLCGAVALEYAKIIDKALGGVAPMWYDNQEGLGGILDVPFIKMKYDLSDEETDREADTKILDKKGLNAICVNPEGQLMLMSHKTTQDPSILNDYSYVGHTMAIDLVRYEMQQKVLRPQVGKAIDIYYMDLRARNANAILEKRTTGARPIWAWATALVHEVNTDPTSTDFKMKVLFKVYKFSETCTLIMENIGEESIA